MTRPVPMWLKYVLIYGSVPLLGVVDWKTGWELNFFVFYFAPISAGAWYLRDVSAVVLSLLSALTWFCADFLAGHQHASDIYAVWNTIVRLAAFLCIGWAVSQMRRSFVREREVAQELRRALSEVKVLESFLPICAKCKKIRDENGEWQQLESYISKHSNTQFSHGYCKECARQAMEEAGLLHK